MTTKAITDTTEAQPTGLPQDDFAQQLLARILPGGRTPAVESTLSTSSTPSAPPPTHTTQGTPCAKSWDAPWIAQVEAAERRLQHRICGARTLNGPPCELVSDHANGRCRYHGGFAHTGAAPGNRNAVIHSLYSRRLRTCSDTCPMWDRCPYAGADIKALKPAQRPQCPYEQMEYDTALTDALARVATNPSADSLHLHIAHSFAAIQVLFNRALKALSAGGLTDTVESVRLATETVGGYKHQSTKVGAYLQAFTKIAAEYRRFATLLEPKNPHFPIVSNRLNHVARTLADTNPDPDVHDLLHADVGAALNETEGAIRDSVERAARGETAEATAAFERARTLAKRYEHSETYPEMGMAGPKDGPAPKAIVDALHKHLNSPPLPNSQPIVAPQPTSKSCAVLPHTNNPTAARPADATHTLTSAASAANGVLVDRALSTRANSCDTPPRAAFLKPPPSAVGAQ
ncbi:MAG: hypothetical protein HZB26_24615 [Candidatus Hydrogenedentes bacterium]|nr:hypothetical protein [Candidatus Hydrogenedentota bacterium]